MPDRVLIVDDQPDVAHVIRAMLPEHHCLDAASAEEALTVLAGERIDLLISDIRMRGMNGLELIPRALAASPQTVVMVMSGEHTVDNAIAAMRVGAFDYIRKPFKREHVRAAVRRALEHGTLLRAKAQYESRLEELVRQRTAELEHLTCYDAVTGLPNRVLCEDRLELALSMAQRGGHKVCLLWIAIDQLDPVKEALGHELADEALREVARRLTGCLGEDDTAARLEGNEFAAILAHVERLEQVGAAVETVRDALCRPLTLDGHDIGLAVSIGIGLYPGDGQSLHTLFHNAHSALCRAREAGGNSYLFYAPEMNAAVRRRLSLESEIRRSVERGDFELRYQPQLDVHTRRIVGAEALVRWRGPEGQAVSSQDFIRVAEDSGLIVPIGEWVFRAAGKQMAIWREQGFAGLKVAVNLSARQVRQKNLARRICRILSETGASAGDFELELTESCVMNDLQSSAVVLRELNDLGLRIALDDFGTGYSSLSYLKKLPVNRLKIDQSFIHDLATDTDSAALVMAIITLAHNLRLEVIAEGVETIKQLKYLQLLGCDQWQGYLYSPAVPADQFEALLRYSANQSLKTAAR